MRKTLERLVRGVALPLCVLAVAAFPSGKATAETKSYVVSWLYQAVYSQDGDCSGLEPSTHELYLRLLQKMGKTQKEAEDLVASIMTGNGGLGGGEAHDLLVYRGRIDGKPVNIYDNPTSAPDDQPVHNVMGKLAPGFNLDGKGAQSANGFEDPETHEQGVNNQYFRAVGCFTSSRAVPPDRPQAWVYGWASQRNAMRAWLMSISGQDLSRDGDVTIAFDKAFEPVMLDANSDVQRNQTFRTDPNPRAHSEFHGKLKDGVITIEPGNFHMVGDAFVIPEWNIRNTHLRLQLKPDGTLYGLMGGYQPWLEVYYMYAQGAFPYESMVGLNLPGIYYSLRRMADVDPDPDTHQNMSISVAYRIEAVPAFQTGVKAVSSIQKSGAAAP